MKQSVEKQIKSAFENWDNQKSEIGFDKAALWNSMQSKRSKVIYLTWFRAAAIIIILFLLGGLGHSYRMNRCLQISNNELLLELSKKQDVQKTEIKKEIETKVIYKTQIKTVESKHAKLALSKLNAKLEEIQLENTKLKEQLNQQNIASNILSDSIINLQAQLKKSSEWYAQQLKNIEGKNQSNRLSIDIDEEALLALSKNGSQNKTTTNYPANKLKITFKNSTRESGTSAPLFKDITSK